MKCLHDVVSKEWGFGDGHLAGLPTCRFGDDVRPKSNADVGKKINRPLTDDAKSKSVLFATVWEIASMTTDVIA
ncbi:hypothetical protein KIN20_017118 [Parelaphostrongylus tenuis]|uniref:Uncharacterized protein n=1 Tax=Parelaphostrongylus tenuis TaxID=148309 RepID=A0AAD5MZI8_PARTN|nr:hypothetical protein KIN20_017118 [Parelaphostrongylus tenuis]